MEQLLTVTNITFALGVFGIVFTIYNYFKTPQEEMDKRQTVSEKEIQGKAEILAQQLQWEKEANERRFKELTDGLNASRSLAENHIHTVDTKVDGLKDLVNSMNINITKEIAVLSTTIAERMPKI